MFLLFHFCSFSQIIRTQRIDDFRNEQFDSLGVLERKTWLKFGDELLLASTEKFNTEGYLVYKDSIVYADNGRVDYRKKRRWKYSNQCVREKYRVYGKQDSIPRALTKRFYEEGLLTKEKTKFCGTGKSKLSFFYYDDFNNCDTLIEIYGSEVNTKTISYKYGLNSSRIISEYHREVQMRFNYEYEEGLNRIYQDGLCIQESYYDEKNRITKLDYACENTPSQTYALNETLSPNNEVLEYNLFDQLSKKIETLPRVLVDAEYSNTIVTEYEYSEKGLLIGEKQFTDGVCFKQKKYTYTLKQ